MAEIAPDIARAAEILAAGGAVCMATETSYGLAVDARNPAALAALTELKGQRGQAPFALIAGAVEQARALAIVWPDLAEILAHRYWPGPLTVVVPARPDLPVEILGQPAIEPWGSAAGVGVRVPGHPRARALAAALGRPITATSANPSGQPPAGDPAQARAYFGDRVHHLAPAEPGPSGQHGAGAQPTGDPPAARPPSTLVAISAHNRAVILRPGPVDLSADRDFLAASR